MNSIDRIIRGTIEVYNIRSDGDTEFILRRLTQQILEELGLMVGDPKSKLP